MPPFKTYVVHIREWRKEEFVDRHESSRSGQPADSRPFLCLVSPDTLALVTAGDAAEGAPTRARSTLGMDTLSRKLSTPKAERPPRHHSRPISLLHKLASGGGAGGGGGDAGGGGSPGGTPAAAAGGGGDAAAQGGEDGLGGELEEGQLLKFTIALSQVASLELQERRVKVMFHRQKPHLDAETYDDWKRWGKAAVLPLALPMEAVKHKSWDVQTFLNRHRRDPFVSSVVLEVESAQEAAALHQALEAAIERLASAVAWLAQDLPLHGRPVPTLVTAAPAGSAAAGQPAGMSSPVRGGAEVAAPGASPAEEQIVCTFPRLQQPMDIPIPGLPADAAGPGSGKGASAAGAALAAAAAAEEEEELQVHVWMHSPLGPAVATITTEQLQHSAEAGGAPLEVVATPHGEAAAGAADEAAATGLERLELVVQFKAERHVARPTSSRRLGSTGSGGRSGSLPGRSASFVRGSDGGGGGSGGEAPAAGGGGTMAMVAVLCLPLLAAWLQLVLLSDDVGATPANSVLASVAFLVSCLAALAAIVVMQVKGLPPPALQAQGRPPAGWWRLTLLHAELVRESQRASSGAPAVRRVVSTSDLHTAASNRAVPRLDGSAPELPAPIRALVAQHPDVLTEDVAARFLVGIGSADKAYQAIQNMAAWVEQQGVADLVRQPQPRFDLIKRHYPQVFYAWSSTADCILEVECTGRWRQAFDQLRALGVTERELLRHQFFCMEYAFKVLDTRPLPQGKTVKIIDLDALTMRDVSSAAFKWYLQVGGALLAVNYPQRLHKAFLVNAPAWSGVIWRVLSAVIPRRVREQLMLFTKKQKDAAAEALQAGVPAEQLPVAYGGTCTVLLGESELEQEMAAYVAQLNAAAGVGSPSRVAGLESSSSARGAAAAVQSASSGGKAAADAGAVQPAAGQR